MSQEEFTGRGADPQGSARPSRSPFRRHWWSIPKVVVAGVIAVLLAGAGGGAIGYGVGEASVPHGGAGLYGRRHSNFGPGGGAGAQVPGQSQYGSGNSANP